MSGLELKCVNSAENEFLAEDYMISIMSGVNHIKLNFISGTYGPFYASMPCKVPLWLAMTLRKRGKCTIIVPDWMSVQSLEKFISDEKNQATLGDLPFYYVEIANLILNNARDDVSQPDKTAALIQDLENIRMDRIRIGVLSIAETVYNNRSVVVAALNNVANMEILNIRSFFLNSMNDFFLLCPPSDGSTQANYTTDNYTEENTGRRLRRFRDN